MATVEQYLDEAASELRTTESPPGSNRTEFASEAGHANGQPWCATFLAVSYTHLTLPTNREV